MSKFTRMANRISRAVGSPYATALGFISVIAWAILGPRFHYSDTWQLVINTSTTIITFLMVFIIQHSQNRDGTVIQLKLDEVIRALDRARNGLIDLEELPDEELERLHAEFARLRNERLEADK